MSPFTITPPATLPEPTSSPVPGPALLQDVVEIGLLLPADWATALLELAKKRQETVGQILRSFIGQALVACEK